MFHAFVQFKYLYLLLSISRHADNSMSCQWISHIFKDVVCLQHAASLKCENLYNVKMYKMWKDSYLIAAPSTQPRGLVWVTSLRGLINFIAVVFVPDSSHTSSRLLLDPTIEKCLMIREQHWWTTQNRPCYTISTILNLFDVYLF